MGSRYAEEVEWALVARVLSAPFESILPQTTFSTFQKFIKIASGRKAHQVNVNYWPGCRVNWLRRKLVEDLHKRKKKAREMKL
jgi:hypothetical protein